MDLISSLRNGTGGSPTHKTGDAWRGRSGVVRNGGTEDGSR